MRKLITTWLCMLLATLSLSGCLSYSQHQLAAVDNWPLSPGAARPSVHLKITTEYRFNGHQSYANTDYAKLEAIILKQYQDSGRFSRATTQQEKSDLYISVHLTNHERGSIAAAILTGATMYLIPSTHSNELTMQTRIKDQDGNLLGEVKKQETITTWLQLLMVFAIPFNQPVDPILEQLTQSSLSQAVQDELL
ncbi:hypothetical protein [Pseudomonas sp. 5P_3.1_Bac2]|uniref:hypothetical protein n=1 Tax=Pseudomonas sp. 5P_3.1_Bac2 TaxID=2971617 RepID=UPI0021C6A788|nr:hypothetical protein [Pseudomonas sp. 5P_3.1_Bac2]MCU1715777.1 hypothetical protein [Pseudomonas sp. 5P_3.1_Bac2]